MFDARKRIDGGRNRRVRTPQGVAPIGVVVDPVLERETACFNKLKDLGNRIGAVLWMQERIDDGRVVSELRRSAYIILRKVAPRQLAKNPSYFLDAIRSLWNVHPSERVLEHVHAGSHRLPIKHDHHDALRRKDPAKRA